MKIMNQINNKKMKTIINLILIFKVIFKQVLKKFIDN